MTPTLGRRSSRLALLLIVQGVLLHSSGCDQPASSDDPWKPRSLTPGPNPFGPDHPLWAPQVRRLRPRASVLTADGATLYVALQGREDEPEARVLALTVPSLRQRASIPVCSAPTAVALHPSGTYLAVTCAYSNYASVIDTRRDVVVASVPVPYYTTSIAFSLDGRRAYLGNRWKDAVLTWSVTASPTRFSATPDGYAEASLDGPMGTAVAPDPDQLLVHPDGRLFVSSITSGTVDVLASDGTTRLARLRARSPVGGMAFAGSYLVLSHIGRGTGFLPHEGIDGDEDGAPGDGTGNVMFQDLQNELDVYDAASLTRVSNVTSDSICCFDYRDVDPGDPSRGERIPAPETWPRERAVDVPPRDAWIVRGALPTRIAVLPRAAPRVTRLLVVMSASNEAQRFDVDDATGRLSTPDEAGTLLRTGHAPCDVVTDLAHGRAYVLNRLGDSITMVDTSGGDAHAIAEVPLDAAQPPRFPATDVELGELFNAVTAPLTVDGDQSCVHCHRDGTNLDRIVAMPLQVDRVWGSRQIQAYRGAFDTRPWFLEAAMDERNFFPVLNEFDRKENFCCEGSDTFVWSGYPGVSTCLATPSLPGCSHVLHCDADPPPECARRPYGAREPTREAFLLGAVERLTGRRTSFGDSLRTPGDGGPIPLGFDGITRSLGLFLLASPRLPPSPFATISAEARSRGRALFERAELGCSACHALPITTLASEPAFSPSRLPIRFAPLITPTLDPRGVPADLVTEGFRATFTVTGIGGAEQGPEGVHLGVPQLRGLWDRAPRFFHDGRARSLRSALLPPGHPALAPGEPGFNERFGTLDTHGGTSQLSDADVDDLVAFLLAL